MIRYEHPAPGDLLHLDIQHLGRFTEVAVRSDGRRRGKHHRGWEYLHVAIDDHSRIAFSQLLCNFTGPSAAAFLHAAVAYYATLGIRIRRLLTDNGHCYRSAAFREACLQLGLRHHFTRPYTPRTNGKAERFIQTLLREWVRARAYSSSDQRNADLPLYLRHYNFHRPHASLNHAPPVSRSRFFGNNLLIHHIRPFLSGSCASVLACTSQRRHDADRNVRAPRFANCQRSLISLRYYDVDWLGCQGWASHEAQVSARHRGVNP